MGCQLRLRQIEEIYHTYSVYKSAVLYGKGSEGDYEALKQEMMKLDYTFAGDGCQECRVYGVYTCAGEGNESHLHDVPWAMVNLVVCLDDASYTTFEEWVRSGQWGSGQPENILIVKI